MIKQTVFYRTLRTAYRRLFPKRLPAHYAVVRGADEDGEDCFQCNVCGARLRLARALMTRESGPCPNCHNYSRLRAMVYALLDQLSPETPILAACEPQPHIKGIGCSDAQTYAARLATVFDYTNTFYDQEPRLDLMHVDRSVHPDGSADFITCSDVLEHVPPPPRKAFENIHRLLKPGGVLVMSVPTSDEAETREHFRDLNEWRIVEEEVNGKRRRVLIDRLPDGRETRHADLCFHGGDGLTLEMRVYSRMGLLRLLDETGFKVRKIYDRPKWRYGVSLEAFNFILVAERSG